MLGLRSSGLRSWCESGLQQAWRFRAAVVLGDRGRLVIAFGVLGCELSFRLSWLDPDRRWLSSYRG